MRTAPGVLVALAATAAVVADARAEGELTARGMYYKEEATRVIQPMLDATVEGERWSGDAHLLIDSITSASVSAGASTGFTERRYQAGGAYRRQLGRLRLGGSARYSTEPDYKSLYGALSADLELLDKNVGVSATVGVGHDDILPAGTLPDEALDLYLGSLAVSQIVSEYGVLGVSYDVIHLDGYQANPYRRKAVPDVDAGIVRLVQENHPRVRTRHALGASLKWYVPGPSLTVIGQYRFYADDWDLRAHTPELRLTKDVGEWILVGARYRYHRQDAAEFYQDEYMDVQTFVSDDAKLSAFDSHLIGARFELTAGALGVVDTLEYARLELVAEYLVQHNHFGNALVGYVTVVLPFEL